MGFFVGFSVEIATLNFVGFFVGSLVGEATFSDDLRSSFLKRIVPSWVIRALHLGHTPLSFASLQPHGHAPVNIPKDFGDLAIKTPILSVALS